MRQTATVFLLIVLTLLSSNNSFPTSRAIAQQQTQHTEVKIDAKLFDDYAGQYSFLDDPEFILSFWREGEKFFLEPTNQVKVEIFPESDSRFFLKVVDAQATFVRGPDGKVSLLMWRQNGQDRRANKISDKPAVETFVPFARREVMIPMRDGVKLHTLVFSPQNQSEALPILINRTPYGVGQTSSDSINRRYRELVRDGYILVLQDIRGRFGSDGQFVMMRPPRDKRDPKSVDESTDTYDTIEWLMKNVEKNNGRAGILGVSYDGWLAAVATLEPHPALRASSPQAPVGDAYLGDDFFHNGAFRQSYGYEYVKGMETSKEETEVSFDKDAYDWYLELGSLSKITDSPAGKLPTWVAFVSHPNYDDHWKARAAARYLKQSSVPTLVVGGWWDQEDFYGALKTYQALEEQDADNNNFVVLGPWNHGGWNGRGKNLGAIDFGSWTGRHFRQELQAPWFRYYLKGQGTLKEAEAVTFQTGCNRWVSYSEWPPREAAVRDLFLRDGKKLLFEKASAGERPEFASYVSDPSNPVPYRQRPIQATYDSKGSGWYTWLVQDQRFLKDRNDVLTWESASLKDNLVVSGNSVAHIYAATTGTDSDWIVKVIDVFPDAYPENPKLAGYQLMVANEIFRGRFRRSFEQPAPLEPGEVYEYVIDLHSLNHCFRTGHRLMVQIQSTWFPLYDRNPQTFVENIFKARPADFQPATQRIYESANYPSRISLPVAE